MRTRKMLMTAEGLLRMPTVGRRLKLVTGRLYEMSLEGARHGAVCTEIGSLLHDHIKANRLGKTFAAGTGFTLGRDPDTVLAPDASFVSVNRLPPGQVPPGFIELAPDLAVEVISPGDTPREVREKVANWLGAGTRLVWAIYPATRSVTVHRSPQDINALSEADELDGGDVVPGFRCRTSDLFQ